VLEWHFFPYLDSFQNQSDFGRLLQEELSNEPPFFIFILRYLFKRDESKPDEQDLEYEKLCETQKMTLAEHARLLLYAWARIPGVKNDGQIDGNVLDNWVDSSRNLAMEAVRLAPADIYIGKLLGKFPETNGTQWPPDEICSVLDRINNWDIFSGFHESTFNKRSFATRSPNEGGNRERQLADYFKSLAKEIEIKWPATTKLLTNMSDTYLAHANEIDDRANRQSLEY
jgi:hypothetical protein